MRSVSNARGARDIRKSLLQITRPTVSCHITTRCAALTPLATPFRIEVCFRRVDSRAPSQATSPSYFARAGRRSLHTHPLGVVARIGGQLYTLFSAPVH